MPCAGEGLYLGDECIHGFSDGLCATCNPKPVPEAPVVTKAAVRPRVARTATSTVRRVGSAPRGGANVAPLSSVLEQRVYHVTNIRNLPAIAASGAILADAIPVVALSPAEQRAARAEITVDAVRGRSLDGFVSFFLTPDATLWQSLRAGSRHPRLSAAALAADTSEFVFLISTVRTLVDSGREFVVTNGSAESPVTRFATTRDDSDAMLYRLRTAANADSLPEAELLVHESLPLESITLVGVQNDKVRAQARDILGAASFDPKIAVYPPWFQLA